MYEETKKLIRNAVVAYEKGQKGLALDDVNEAIMLFEAVADCGLPSDEEIDRQIACRIAHPHEAAGDYLLLARDSLLKELGATGVWRLMPVKLALNCALSQLQE